MRPDSLQLFNLSGGNRGCDGGSTSRSVCGAVRAARILVGDGATAICLDTSGMVNMVLDVGSQL